MKVFVCTDHAGVDLSTQVASVIVAPDEKSARAALDAELKRRTIAGHHLQVFTLDEISTTEPAVHILADGSD